MQFQPKQLNLRRITHWSIVRILGKTIAKAKTSNYTYSSREKNFPSAGSVGAA
jgi:hypothetical protein